MFRRDLLKFIGVAGAALAVKPVKEAEAAEKYTDAESSGVVTTSHLISAFRYCGSVKYRWQLPPAKKCKQGDFYVKSTSDCGEIWMAGDGGWMLIEGTPAPPMGWPTV